MIRTKKSTNLKSAYVHEFAAVYARDGAELPPLLHDYRAGRTIFVPRIEDIRKWSCRNRVEPVGGY